MVGGLFLDLLERLAGKFSFSCGLGVLVRGLDDDVRDEAEDQHAQANVVRCDDLGHG